MRKKSSARGARKISSSAREARRISSSADSDTSTESSHYSTAEAEVHLNEPKKQFTRKTNHVRGSVNYETCATQLRVTTKGDKANEHRSEKKMSSPFLSVFLGKFGF